MATTRLLSAMVATWNNVATTFTGLKLNVTDTASASGSLLMDLQKAGASKFSIDKNGQAISAIAFWTKTNSLTAGYYFGAGADLSLTRDAANTLALRNGTAAQAFNVYNTYTDASNYERAELTWNATANAYIMRTIAAGTGSFRNMILRSGGTLTLGSASADHWVVDHSGHFVAATDNTYDIGASGANRPRTIYAGTSFVAPDAGTFRTPTRGSISFPVDGSVAFANFAGTQSVTFTVGASNLLTLNGGLKTTGATFALQTATTLTDNAAAQVATMTNGPTAGNPTKWIAINDNGTTRYIPAW